MTEKEARRQGLETTGIYYRNKEETKKRILEERKKCPQARIVLVTVPDSPLSRGGRGTGYAAYGDEVYRAYSLLEHANQFITAHPRYLQSLKREYDAKVEDEVGKCEEWKKIAVKAEATIKGEN